MGVWEYRGTGEWVKGRIRDCSDRFGGQGSGRAELCFAMQKRLGRSLALHPKD